MKKMLLGTLLACAAATSHAFDQQGVFIGGGAASITLDDDCANCDSTGLLLEGGFDINRTVGLDIKIAQTSEEGYFDLDLTYVGVNLGSDFNTHWFKLYGKLGLAHVKESLPGYEARNDSNIAIGAGVRFTPVYDQRGFYIKLDVISSRFLDMDMGVGMFSLGYKF